MVLVLLWLPNLPVLPGLLVLLGLLPGPDEGRGAGLPVVSLICSPRDCGGQYGEFLQNETPIHDV